MTDTCQYTTLICSLPAYGSLFASRQTPISRFQMERRLTLLEENDAHDIEILGQILDWFRHPLNRSDEELLLLIKRLVPEVHSSSIKHYIKWRLEFRTLIAALRKKHCGQKFDIHKEWSGSWPGNRWLQHIVQHWQEPVFGLEKHEPWLMEVKRLLENEKAAQLEKYILMLVWAWLEKESFGHEFDLEAVAIYRMRWDLVARWTCYARKPAEDHFKNLLNQSLES